MNYIYFSRTISDTVQVKIHKPQSHIFHEKTRLKPGFLYYC